MTLEQRATGWLDTTLHSAMREVLLHTCHRYEQACPAYCLMPDHAHFLFVGLIGTADQRLAVAWLRRQWNALLAPTRVLQRQAHDHVLRDEERRRDAFVSVANYILTNPERKGLAGKWSEWRFSGGVFPGVYAFDPRSDGYWERFWREYERRAGA